MAAKKKGKSAEGGGKASAGSGGSAGDPRQELLKELRGLIREIDQEGLLFLIKQANTLIYNQRVDRLNRAAEETRQREAPAAETGQPTASGEGVSIEKGAFGRSFILDLAGVRKTFAEAEMLGLVRAGAAGGEAADGAARLYRWLKRNRDDLLLDAGIARPGDPVLTELWRVLRTSFTIREQKEGD